METPKPFTSPITAPTETAASTAVTTLPPSRRIVAPTAALIPRVAPMDTSISPVRITKAIPTARSVNTTESFKQFSRLAGCQKSLFTSLPAGSAAPGKASFLLRGPHHFFTLFMSALSFFFYIKRCIHQCVLIDFRL